MRIVCISDTHGRHDRLTLPPGDLLIHAGDFTRHGKLEEVDPFNDWLGRTSHLYRHKVVIAGNHDFCFQQHPAEARARLTHATYLEDAAVVLDGIKVYGSPWQPFFGGWAFNLHRGEPLAAVWAKIPADTHILVTHGPPEGVLDRNKWGDLCGCRDLLMRVYEVRPRLHVFGHIHEAAGRDEVDGITFVNAAPAESRAAEVVDWDDHSK